MKTRKTPTRQKKAVVQPDTVEVLPIQQPATSGIVKLSNLRTGRIVSIGAKAALMLSEKYPNEFKIL